MPTELPDPSNFDPAILLTLAGGTIAAGIISSLIEALKRLPGLGQWVSANAAAVATLASFALVFAAYLTTTTVINAVGLFGAFVASLGVAAISGKAYDVAVTVKASSS